MTCSNCGAEIEDGMKFCGECGAPAPQVKKCIQCGAELPLKMKFCPECGARQDGQSNGLAKAAGFSMGDKNVIAGDVTGHKEETHISGNATIIKNEDESRKVVTCHVCGKHLLMADSFTCMHCGEITCADCYDRASRLCKNCSASAQASSEESYKELLHQVLADGRIDMSERQLLNAKRQELGLTVERAMQLENEMRGKTAPESMMTTIEKVNLKRASDMFYEDGRAQDALAVAEPVYQRHKYDEDVLTVYLPVLAACDSGKALSVAESITADILPVYLVRIDAAMASGDLISAERVLNQTMMLWPDEPQVQARQAEYLCAVYKETGVSDFLSQAQGLCAGFADAAEPLGKSWQERARRVVALAQGQKAVPLDAAACKAQGLLFGVLCDVAGERTEVTVGGADGFTSIKDALAAVAADGTVHVLAGTWAGDFSVDKPVHLIGEPGACIQLAADDIEVTADAVISGLAFKSSNEDCDANLVVKGTANPQISDLIMDRCCIGVLEKASGSYRNCESFNGFYGFVVSDQAAPVVSGLKVHDITYSPADEDSDEAFKSTGCGLLFDAVSGSSDASFTDCTFKNCRTGIAVTGQGASPAFSSCTLSDIVSSGIICLGGSNPQFTDCTVAGGCDGVAADDDGIRADAGTFTGCTVCGFDSGIRISNDAGQVLSKCKVYDCVTGINLTSNAGGTVSDCEIRDMERGVCGPNSFDETVRTVFKNCTVIRCSCSAVDLRYNAEPEFIGCTIGSSVGEGGSAHGVLCDHNVKARFTDCIISDTYRACVRVTEKACPVFKGCKVTGSKIGGGFFIVGNAKGSYTDCEAYDNTYSGFEVSGSAAPEVCGCKAYKSSSGGGFFIRENAGGTYTGCEAYDNKTAGFEVRGSAAPVMRSCNAYKSTAGGGFFIHEHAAGTFEDCEARDNTCVDIEVKGAAPTMIRCSSPRGWNVHDNTGGAVFTDCKGEGLPAGSSSGSKSTVSLSSGNARKGTSSKVSIKGASYSYKNGGTANAECTLKAERVQNDSPWDTGDLKLIFWLSKNGKYNGGTLDGIQMAELPFNEGLKQGFGFPNVNKTGKMPGKPKPGTYQPVITVNELHESGKWYIVGWANFTNPITWH